MNTRRIPFWKSFLSLLFAAYGVSTILLVGIFTVLVFENQTDLIAENALYASLTTGESINATLEESKDAEKKDWPECAKKIRRNYIHEPKSLLSLKFFNENGELLYSENEEEPSLKDIRDVNAAIAKREFENKLFHHRVNVSDRSVILFIPFVSDSDTVFVAQANMKIAQIDARIAYMNRQALIITLTVILVHGAFAFFAFQTFIRPLRILMKSIDRIADGEYDVLIPEFRPMEFNLLSEKIRQMGSAVRDMQDTARSANPLTGLPGNVEIQKRIGKRIELEEPFCVLYADLDNFKAYNDSYGFHKGDDVILFTRDVLIRAVEESYAENAFIGHQGGDDFVVISRMDDWEAIANRCVSLFDKGIGDFYSKDDRDKKGIETLGRDGKKTWYPIGSLSVAIVSNENRRFGNIGEVAKIAAEVKKYVKSIKGSAFAIDRRID